MEAMVSTKPRIFVTTAAGKTGTALTHQLHDALNFAVSAADAGLEVVVDLTQWLAEHPSVKLLREHELNFAFANVQ